jgi:CRISPR-associated protein Csm3
MLQRLLNECVLTVELAVSGRLLVQEPQQETKERVQDQPKSERAAQPVRARRPDGSWSIYLPGASLKGALRAQAERIARTLNEHSAGACDPFSVIPRDGSPPPADLACSERIVARQRYHERQQRQTSKAGELTIPQRYRDVCPVCRTFGHLGWGRRLRIADFYPVEEPGAVQMTHISVDRVGGGVSAPYLGRRQYGSGRTFTLEYAYRTRLKGQIILENFELWQLGLLGFLWQDMADGLLPVGHKQTTGTGELHPHLVELCLTRLGPSQPMDGELRGVGALFPDAQRYGYDPVGDVLTWAELRWTLPAGAIRWEARLHENAAQRLWQTLAPKTATVLREHQWPDSMQPDRIASLGKVETVP